MYGMLIEFERYLTRKIDDMPLFLAIFEQLFWKYHPCSIKVLCRQEKISILLARSSDLAVEEFIAILVRVA